MGKNYAYELAMKRYTESQWISVRDELPKEEGKYIVCTEKGSVYCTRFVAGCGHEGIFRCDTNTHITHWMPLPEPPKREKCRRENTKGRASNDRELSHNEVCL